MPDDNSFDLPDLDATPATSPTSAPTPEPTPPVLTDPVMPEQDFATPAPEVSAPLPEQPPVVEPASTPQPEVDAAPPQTPPSHLPPAEEPPALPVPATLATSPRSGFPVLLVIILLLTLVTIAVATFFWIQNQTLTQQISAIQDTLDHRQTEPVPTPLPTQPLVTATPSATPTSSPSAILTGGLTAFADISAIIQLAQTEAPSAQMIMITAENLQSPSTSVFKYWFRRSSTTKSYFFVQKSANSSPQIFSQASVTPDNNIPELNQTLTSNQGGADSDAAHQTIKTGFLDTYAAGVAPVSISAKYLKAQPNSAAYSQPTFLWQFSYKFGGNPQDVIVQIDALTKQIIYTSR